MCPTQVQLGILCSYWNLTYLTGSVHPDIAMAVHQCACFSVNPMYSHKQAVMQIGQYLLLKKKQKV
jgi:hypothetical protein